MPYRKIYIPENVIPELEKYGFDSNKAKREGEIINNYLVFYSEKGDSGAVLARYGVPKEKIGLCVEIVKNNGGYVEGVYGDKKSVQTQPPKYNQKPQQLALPEIFEKTQYDETSHLTPNGKRKRRKKG